MRKAYIFLNFSYRLFIYIPFSFIPTDEKNINEENV